MILVVLLLRVSDSNTIIISMRYSNTIIISLEELVVYILQDYHFHSWRSAFPKRYKVDLLWAFLVEPPEGAPAVCWQLTLPVKSGRSRNYVMCICDIYIYVYILIYDYKTLYLDYNIHI